MSGSIKGGIITSASDLSSQSEESFSEDCDLVPRVHGRSDDMKIPSKRAIKFDPFTIFMSEHKDSIRFLTEISFSRKEPVQSLLDKREKILHHFTKLFSECHSRLDKDSNPSGINLQNYKTKVDPALITVLWLAQQKKFGSLLVKCFPEYVEIANRYKPLITEIMKIQNEGNNENGTTSNITARLVDVEPSLTNDDSNCIVKMLSYPVIQPLMAGGRYSRTIYSRSHSIDLVDPKKPEQETSYTKIRKFLREANMDIMELLNKYGKTERLIKNDIDTVVEQLKLYNIVDKPISENTEEDRYNSIICGILRWICRDEPYTSALKQYNQLPEMFKRTEDDERLFSSITEYFTSLKYGRETSKLDLISSAELHELLKLLYIQNMVYPFTAKSDSHNQDHVQKVWDLIKNNDDKCENLNKHIVDDNVVPVQDEFKISVNDKTVNLPLSKTRLSVIDQKEVDHGWGTLESTQFRETWERGTDHIYGKSPSNEDERLATIYMGLSYTSGCFQYVSCKRMNEPHAFSLHSIVDYLQFDLKPILDRGEVFKINDLTLTNIEHNNIPNHTGTARSVLVTFKNQNNEIVKVPFTQAAFPYEMGGLSSDSISEGLEIQQEHLKSVDYSRVKSSKNRIDTPIILSRGGSNRCAQHIISYSHKKWLAHSLSTLNYAVSHEIDVIRDGCTPDLSFRRMTKRRRFNENHLLSANIKINESLNNLGPLIFNIRKNKKISPLNNRYSFDQIWSYGRKIKDLYKDNAITSMDRLKDFEKNPRPRDMELEARIRKESLEKVNKIHEQIRDKLRKK